MSWFNASQLSSFAKQALSQAQKSIDRVLDIQEEEPSAWAETIPYGEPGSKWVLKQQTVCNINNTYGPGTTNEHTVQWWFKKFCLGDKSLEDEEHIGQPLEADND